jgi:hypothetical protein
MSPARSRLRLLVPLVALTLLAAACGSSGSSKGAGNTGGSTAQKVTLRLGYFANVTHAPAIVGIANGEFAKALGTNVTLKSSIYAAGPAAVEALFAKSIDASFVGPNPAINAYAQSQGAAIRIVAGTASGGAFFVVNKDIKTAADLKGKKVGSPSLGNTQDVSLRYWLKQQGLSTDTSGGGDVKILPGPDNGTVVQEFQQGDIAGAWRPHPRQRGEPLARRQVRDHAARGAHRLPQRAPRRRGEPHQGALRVDRSHEHRPDQGRGHRLDGDPGRDEQAAEGQPGRAVVHEHHVHARSDRFEPQDRRRARRVPGHPQADRPHEPLRPHAGEQVPDL